jgi:hypothetical protein
VSFSATKLQEEFSVAYLHALATAAGFSIHRDPIDEDSIDVTVIARGWVAERWSPRFLAQLKCTFAHAPKEAGLSFPLGIKNYDDLRMADVSIPRVLIVVHVPEEARSRIVWSSTELVLKNCGYWTSIKGLEAKKNSESVTVHLPHRLSVEELKRVMELTARGEI